MEPWKDPSEKKEEPIEKKEVPTEVEDDLAAQKEKEVAALNAQKEKEAAALKAQKEKEIAELKAREEKAKAELKVQKEEAKAEKMALKDKEKAQKKKEKEEKLKEQREKAKAEGVQVFNERQESIARAFFVILTTSVIICIGGVALTITDTIQPSGKWGQFWTSSFGFILAVLGGLFACLFMLLVLFSALFKKGKTRILKILFKEKKEVLEKYRGKTGIKLIAGGVLASIILIIVGIIYSFIDILLSGAGTGGLVTFIENLGGGQFVLLMGLIALSLIALILLFKYLIDNGYLMILKIFYSIDEKDT